MKRNENFIKRFSELFAIGYVELIKVHRVPKLLQFLYCWCCIVDIDYLNNQNSVNVFEKIAMNTISPLHPCVYIVTGK